MIKIDKYDLPAEGTIYKPKSPWRAKIAETERLTEEESPNEIRNIIIDLSGSGMKYIEGQSIGVIPPGVQENGKPNKTRLYSIASSRTGEDGTSTTVTLCVKRVVYKDEETGEEKEGLCSSYLCDLRSGDELDIIGPTGRTFLLPSDSNTDLIMLAAGTGIAPFRAFIHHIYKEHKNWNGQVRLFFGARTGMDAIYMNRQNQDIGLYQSKETFEAFQALSDVDEEHKRAQIPDRLDENGSEVWEIIKRGNFCLYICGMKGLGEGADNVFEKLAQKDGKNWAEMKAEFRKQGRWNLELY